MIESEIVVVLPGKPTPAGSLKCVGGRGRVRHQLVQDYRPGQKEWRQKVTDAVRKGVTQRADKWQPVGVEVTFTIERPAGHWGTGRNATRLKPSAPTFPTKHNTNDLDKMERLLGDALQDAEMLPDDAQIVDYHARKCYPDCPHTAGSLPWPGARIRIYPIQMEATLL